MICATQPILDFVAVANVQPLLSAIAPDCVLDEAREGSRVRLIETSRVNRVGGLANDLGATVSFVTAWSVRVIRPQAPNNAGTAQKVMNQPIDDDHFGADPAPTQILSRRAH